MFFFQRRADASPETVTEGVIHEVIRQGKEWRVRVYGVYWTAKAQMPLYLLPGDYVRVTGRRELTLWIEPS